MPSLGRMRKRIVAINNAKDIDQKVKDIVAANAAHPEQLVFGRANRRRYAQALRKQLLDDLVHVPHKS